MYLFIYLFTRFYLWNVSGVSVPLCPELTEANFNQPRQSRKGNEVAKGFKI